MLEKKISLFTNNKGNEFLTQLEATLELSDKLDSVVEAVKSIPETVIPETLIPEYPSEMAISNLPDVQKVEITNLPTEKDDKEQLALLKEISLELKKKEEYAYDIEIDSTLKEQLRGEKGESGKDGKSGTEITANEVALKLESLEGDDRLDVSAVKGTEELIDDIATSIVKAEIKKIPKPTVYMGSRGSSSSSGGVQSVVAGSNITVDNTDPANPIVSSTGGSSSITNVSISTDTTLSYASGEYIILCDATSCVLNITLPNVSSTAKLNIIKIDSSSNAVNLIGNVNGVTDKAIGFQNTCLTIVSTGIYWRIV